MTVRTMAEITISAPILGTDAGIDLDVGITIMTIPITRIECWFTANSDDFYKWVGGDFLAGEIIHHTRD